jgi:hypothetical protein
LKLDSYVDNDLGVLAWLSAIVATLVSINSRYPPKEIEALAWIYIGLYTAQHARTFWTTQADAGSSPTTHVLSG